MFIRTLALSNFTHRKSRVALTVAAVAMSVSLVVAVTSGYASLFESAFKFLNVYMGSTDARMECPNQLYGIPTTLVQELQKDPDVRRADGRLNVHSVIFDPDPQAPPPATKSVRLIGIERPGDRRVDRLPFEAGGWFDTPGGYVAVIDQAVAAIEKIKVGDNIVLPYPIEKRITLKVVGIVHKPGVVAAHMRTIYLPVQTLQQMFPESKGQYSSVLIDLVGQADPQAFKQRWQAKLAAYKPQPKIHLSSDLRQQMDNNLQNVQLLSYLGGAVSMLAATFIIFSALSMGVSERQRSLAMLRAVGAYKKQIAGLVVFEGLILGLLGLVVGVPLGWICIKVLSMIFRDLFTAGAVLSWGGLLFGGVGTLVTALLASLLPAWNATRVSPLEAMSPLSQGARTGPPIGWAIIGSVLAAIDPFMFFGPLPQIMRLLHVSNPDQAARHVKYYAHFILGLPGLFLGFFLLAPMFVWLTERLAGPLVARIFGLRYAMLRQQLSSGMWRAAGTCAALMVGLAVLIVMQVTGQTMLNGWRLPDKFPDVFIATNGLSDQEEQQLAATPGIKSLMPVTIAATALGTNGGNPFVIAGSLAVPGSTMFIGVDPYKAMEMMQLEFREGNKEDAAARLSQGDWVIVTQEYRQLTGAKIGDPIVLGGHTFHIAAVVWSPGLDVMAGMYDLGDQLEQRTVSSVFGSVRDSQKYFGGRPYVFAAELEMGVEREALIKQISTRLKSQSMQVGDVREIKSKIQQGFFRLLTMVSTVAFAAMAVASLGVTNTIMAGVRSRRWQFGVLRSIGVTRSHLLRLVLAEAMLLGLIGCALGLSAGAEMSVNARALTATVVGYQPPIKIRELPWKAIEIGLGSVLFISLAASLWPALQVARAEPLALLQAGRSSA